MLRYRRSINRHRPGFYAARDVAGVAPFVLTLLTSYRKIKIR
jgi:hypothetical protein